MVSIAGASQLKVHSDDINYYMEVALFAIIRRNHFSQRMTSYRTLRLQLHTFSSTVCGCFVCFVLFLSMSGSCLLDVTKLIGMTMLFFKNIYRYHHLRICTYLSIQKKQGKLIPFSDIGSTKGFTKRFSPFKFTFVPS